MSKSTFRLLSYTWGLPMTLIGRLAALILTALGFKHESYGYCTRFEVGENWGGVSLGNVIITGRNSTTHTKDHEHGHALQNVKYGLLMPFVVAIPSFVRYWYFVLRIKLNKRITKSYDSIWFEGEATKLGTEFMDWYRGNSATFSMPHSVTITVKKNNEENNDQN